MAVVSETIYTCSDGKVFNNHKEAEVHEIFIAVNKIKNEEVSEEGIRRIYNNCREYKILLDKFVEAMDILTRKDL